MQIATYLVLVSALFFIGHIDWTYMPLLIGANLLAHKAFVKGNIRVSVSFHYFGIDLQVFIFQK